MRESFILYTKYTKHINLLSLEQRGVLLTAIMSYNAGEDLPDMDGMTEMAFSFIRSDLDDNEEKYQKTIEARREAGSKGGSKRSKSEYGKQNEANEANAIFASEKKANEANAIFASKKIANEADNDNDYVNDNVLKEKNIKREKFTPPTVEEVKDYVDEKGYAVDPERFVNFYESKGWMIGKNKMKSWKAAVATWEKNNSTRGQPEPDRKGHGNKFNNFPQRQYDFEELEKQLLAVQRS